MLKYREDRRSVLVILICLCVYAAQWTGLMRHPGIYLASFLLAFMACVINHNHQHLPMCRSRWGNSVMDLLITFAMGLPAKLVLGIHVVNHHRHNNGPEDASRSGQVDYRFRPFNLLMHPFKAIASFLPIKRKLLKTWKVKRRRLVGQLMIQRYVFLIVVVVLLIARPKETLIYIILPWGFGQWFVLASNHFQHVGCDPSSRYNNSRNITGRWVNWWMFNTGFHTAHHLKPRLHWSRLPLFHRTFASELDPALQTRSLLGVLLKLYVLPESGGTAKREDGVGVGRF